MILRREVQKIRSGKWEELEEVYRNYKSPFRALGQAIGGGSACVLAGVRLSATSFYGAAGPAA